MRTCAHHLLAFSPVIFRIQRGEYNSFSLLTPRSKGSSTMPELPTPRSTKRRRLQSSLQLASPPSVNCTVSNFNNLKIPQTPTRSPAPPHRPSAHSSASATSTHVNATTDILASQIYDLFKKLDEFRDSLSRSYDAERKARQEAHEATQRKLGDMQDLVLSIAGDYAQVKRRERMGVVGLELFGASGVVSPGKRELNGEFEDSMVDYEAEEDVDMGDFDDSQGVELGLDESSTTLGSRVQGPMQVGLEGEGEEEEELETEDDSLPVARARQRRHVSQTISPTMPPQHLHEGSTTESDTPAEDESETISVRALKRSLQLGTRVKKSQGPREQKPSTADQEFHRRGTQLREGATSQTFSQYSVPPNPEEDDDETYRESPITTPEREVQPVEQRLREISQELEYGLSSPRKQRPQRKTAQVENYYDWDRYVTGVRVPVSSTPAQNKDKGREHVNGPSLGQVRRGGRSSDSSPGLEIVESRVVGTSGKGKNGKRQSIELGESSGEVIVVKARRL
ncbi:hypothetical protein TWF281_005828 [Arthrobotrys megalospora]